MNTFNPTRLTLARKRRGFTGKQLADLAGLTAVHISRIEQHKAENIEQSTVDAIAKALKFPKGFFYKNDVDQITKESASFRSLTAMTATERESALSAGSFAFDVSDWISERFNLPELDIIDLSYERSPEVAARLLRARWGLGEQPIGNVIKLLESKGIRVFSLAEDTKNVDAFSCWRNNVPYIFLNTFKTSERSRFDALHELGHLVLHTHGQAQGREAEMEANKFASHFLITPIDLIANIPVVTSLNQLVKAKERWGVSVAALAYRLHKSGCISDWQYRTFCIQINNKYGTGEPNGLPREVSVVWNKVFLELWKDGKTRDDIFRDLSIPREELESLVFSLVENVASKDINIQTTERPKLKLVHNV